jgi:DNA-directed RNA polymerase specialized sigma24 family protein
MPVRSYVASLVTEPEVVREIVDEAFATVARLHVSIADAGSATFAVARTLALGRAPAPHADGAVTSRPSAQWARDRRIAAALGAGSASAANDAAIEDAIASLGDRPREILLLRWLGRLGRDEIADVLGVSGDVVARELAAAFEVLRHVRLIVGTDRGRRVQRRTRSDNT